MMVYALMGGIECDSYVVGIFSSEEKALKEKENILKKDKFYQSNSKLLYVDVFVLDEVKQY